MLPPGRLPDIPRAPGFIGAPGAIPGLLAAAGIPTPPGPLTGAVLPGICFSDSSLEMLAEPGRSPVHPQAKREITTTTTALNAWSVFFNQSLLRVSEIGTWHLSNALGGPPGDSFGGIALVPLGLKRCGKCPNGRGRDLSVRNSWERTPFGFTLQSASARAPLPPAVLHC